MLCEISHILTDSYLTNHLTLLFFKETYTSDKFNNTYESIFIQIIFIT